MKRKKGFTYKSVITVFLTVAALILMVSQSAVADVSPGDVLDSKNWQKAEGLLPEEVLNHIKNGDMVIKVGKLNFDPASIYNDCYLESRKTNIGKYGINEKDIIYNVETGEEAPVSIVGFPFPVIDPKDPQMAIKYAYNQNWAIYNRQNTDMDATLMYIGKGLERTITGPQMTMIFTGSPEKIAIPNPDRLKSYFIMKVDTPFELNGLATMTWKYIDDRPDQNFAYVPALRRVRRTSPASRSDAMFGTDYTVDDAAGGFMGSPPAFKWKYVGTQDALVQWVSSDPIEAVENADGTVCLKTPYNSAVFGCETEGWQGKPWAQNGTIWVKRKVHVFELEAKDPYYNYGKMILWGDTETFRFTVKVIYDRAGKYWKMMLPVWGAMSTPNGSFRHQDSAFGDVIVDEQIDHATGIREYHDKQKKIFRAILNPKNFTAGGFAKFCK